MVLTIKKKWFDMIFRREKKEEYREIKPYYTSRFKKLFADGETKRIVLRNGYKWDSPTFMIECRLKKGFGREEWGAEKGKEYYILEILDVMAHIGYCEKSIHFR